MSVVIIGSGPSGLAAGAELARQGIDFVILEQSSKRHHQTRGTGLAPRTFELLEPYGNVVSQVLENSQKVTRVSANGKAVNYRYMFKDTDYNFAFVNCSQSDFESYLESHLESKNIQIIRNTQVIGVHDFGSHVEVKTSNGVYNCQYVIAADGAKSLIRKSFGIPYDGLTKPFVCITFHFEADRVIEQLDRELFLIEQDHRGLFSFSTMRREREYQCMIYFNEQDSKLYESEELDSHGLPLIKDIPEDVLLSSVKSRLGVDISFKRIIWKSTFRINNRIAQKFSASERIYLVGDAVHSANPIYGLGLNFGVQDSINIAWKVSLVLKGQLDKRILGTFESERRMEALKLMDLTLGKFDRKQGIHFSSGLSICYRSILSPSEESGHRLPPKVYQKLNLARNIGFLMLVGKNKYEKARKIQGFQFVEKIVQSSICEPDQVLLIRPDGYLAFNLESVESGVTYLHSISSPNAKL